MTTPSPLELIRQEQEILKDSIFIAVQHFENLSGISVNTIILDTRIEKTHCGAIKARQIEITYQELK